ncbi:AAA family ATPase [Lactovum odontotermitis]
MNNRKYIVINGSKSYFKSKLPKNEHVVSVFLDLVKESDEKKTLGLEFNSYADVLIVFNDNYNGIVEQAHDRLGVLIEELTKEDSVIYIHNPPIVLKEYLSYVDEKESCTVEYHYEKYTIDENEKDFVQNLHAISENIIGQELALKEITKSMWYLTKTERKKPYVIMLYGKSSLGKTQVVREIAEKFYAGKFFEKHLSMFMNNTYSDYFFGEKPNRKTLGFDLLERNSNLIFLDELDKCPEYFYSAFYTLFDSEVFKDASYEVDTSGMFIILTSNYLSEKEMKEKLGLPIYYRIDKFIPFNDFTTDTIYQVVKKEIRDRESEYSDLLTADDVYNVVSQSVLTKGENARTIKYKIQQVIEELLFREIGNRFDS